MKKLLIIITTLLFATAQIHANNDAIIFKAMQEEMDRSVNGLKMPDMPAPFWINFIVAEGETLSITASLGGIVQSNYRPLVRSGWVRALTESSEITSDARFSNQGRAVNLTVDNDADQIRRDLWAGADADYKQSLELLTIKKNALRRMNLTEEEQNLKDFNLPKSIKLRNQPKNFVPFSQPNLENQMRTLSAIFKNYSKIHTSSVTLSAQQSSFYIVNSQGSEIKEPSSNVVIRIRAEIRAEDGALLRDERVIVAENINKLPNQAALERIVNQFADDLQKLAAAPDITEYYSGPVLFENQAAADIFIEHLLTADGVVFSRRPIVAGNPQFTANKPLGRKVVDTRLTVVNHTNKNSHKGMDLVGAYNIDAEGVQPQARQLLVERGLLRQILNASVPNEIAAHSNGNLRLGIFPTQTMTEIKPSVLEITSSQTLTPARLKQRLISTAKSEGLDYAYIVRQLSGAIKIYQVDVRTGRETLMRSPDLERITMARLKRFDAVSNEEFVENRMLASDFVQGARDAFPMAIICPAGILFQDVEIKRQTGHLEVLPTVRNPTER